MASEHNAISKGTTVLPPADTAAPGRRSRSQRRDTLIAASQPAYKWWVAGTVMLSAFLVVVNTSNDLDRGSSNFVRIRRA